MVKSGLYSLFVNWTLIWACLTGNLDRVERLQITGFHQSSMEVEFSHKLLKLNLVRLECQGIDMSQKQIYASKLSLNPKIGIMTILHQFRDKAARVRFFHQAWLFP
jgi:hypothetical protein